MHQERSCCCYCCGSHRCLRDYCCGRAADVVAVVADVAVGTVDAENFCCSFSRAPDVDTVAGIVVAVVVGTAVVVVVAGDGGTGCGADGPTVG